jgi:hypothetical protein
VTGLNNILPGAADPEVSTLSMGAAPVAAGVEFIPEKGREHASWARSNSAADS